MNFLARVFNWMGRALLPVRLRPSVLQVRLQSTLDRTVTGLEKGASKATQTAERIEGGEPPKTGKLGIILKWVVHFIIVGLVLYLLYWINYWLQLDRVLRSDWPSLHAYWLPLLGLLLYGMAWLAWWIWELTGPEKLTNDFPDIDHAFKEGLRCLADSSIDVRDVPIFLVLGRPLEDVDNVFLAAQQGFLVREVPRWPEAPVRFSGNKDAVYITCVGASVLGKHVSMMIEEQREALSYAEVNPNAAGDVAATSPADFPAEEKPLVDVQAVIAQAQQEGRGPDQLSEEERRVISLLVAEERSERPGAASRRRVFLKNKAHVQETMARLQHLCQLLARHRRPYCPLNGIMVLVPFSATDSDEDATQATTATQLDLSVVRETLQVQCPVFTLACDVEKTPGFRELMLRIPQTQRDRRMGQRFPLIADIDAAQVPELVDDGVGWLSYTFLPALVYSLFRLENEPGRPGAGLPEVVSGNMRLYRLLSEMRLRRKRLARLCTRGLLLDSPPSFFFGGLYLAGTGPDVERDRGFVSGVFQRLPENQNSVTWTPDAITLESDYHRWTRYGYGLFVLLIIAIVALIYRLWFA